MRWARKKNTRVQAWQLGMNTQMEQKMVKEGKIRLREDGRYELFSQEATGEVGQIACAGDYFKVDPPGYPYPNEKDMFEARHRHIEDDWYEQISEPVRIWTVEDPDCEEVLYLKGAGQLRIHFDDNNTYFSAKLWGTEETAARDAVIVFYNVVRDRSGAILMIDFNFVERGYFERTYEVLTDVETSRKTW